MPWSSPGHYTYPMSRLHSDKTRQIGGIIALALFLLLAAKWFDEDTGEGGLAVVIGGAAVAFIVGFAVAPSVRSRFSALKRGDRHSRRSSSTRRRP